MPADKAPVDVLTSFYPERDGTYTVTLLVTGLTSPDMVDQVKAWCRSHIVDYAKGLGNVK
jgi:hypothetical protein